MIIFEFQLHNYILIFLRLKNRLFGKYDALSILDINSLFTF